MNTINTTALVKTSTASATTYQVDKNGLLPTVFTPLAGGIPNKSMFVSGTVAEREGMLSNKMYLVQIVEGNRSDLYGRQFRVSNLGEVSALEFATKKHEFIASLGKPEIFTVEEEPVSKKITTGESVEEDKF